MGTKTHFAQVLRWSAEGRASRAEALAAGLGMGLPILLGGLAGALPAGMAAGLGSMAVSATVRGATLGERWQAFRAAFVPVLLAAASAVLLAGHGQLSGVLTVAVVGSVALASSYSRELAVAATRYLLFLLISMGLGGGARVHAAVLLPIAAGALWTALLGMLLAALAGRLRSATAPVGARAGPAAAAQATAVTAAQRWRRWRQSLQQAAGWQYAVRLSLALAAATALQWTWPAHHFTWSAMTVALLTQRQPEPISARSTQRVLGTVLGVGLASLIVGHHPALWLLALGAGALASARPVLRAGNYLAYSAVMTPLILLILEAHAPLGSGLLWDRVAATLAGAGLVLLVDLAAVRLLAGSARATSAATTGGTTAGTTATTTNRRDTPA